MTKTWWCFETETIRLKLELITRFIYDIYIYMRKKSRVTFVLFQNEIFQATNQCHWTIASFCQKIRKYHTLPLCKNVKQGSKFCVTFGFYIGWRHQQKRWHQWRNRTEMIRETSSLDRKTKRSVRNVERAKFLRWLRILPSLVPFYPTIKIDVDV